MSVEAETFYLSCVEVYFVRVLQTSELPAPLLALSCELRFVLW